MKTSLIIFTIVLIVGGVVVYNLPTKQEALAPTAAETGNSPQPQDPTTMTAAEHGMTEEEHAKMMEDMKGNDVGMEMPETDMTNPGSNMNTGSMDHSTMNMGDMDHSSMNMNTKPSEKVFTVSGKNFAFDVTEIRVKQGDTVTINFTSADGFHDLVIDEFAARSEKVKTGNTSKVTFVASKKGTFEYYCSVGSHRANGMTGKLIVE